MTDDNLKDDWKGKDDPCTSGYTMVGTKPNGNPRCVDEEDTDNYDESKSVSLSAEEKQDLHLREVWKDEEDPCQDGYTMVGTQPSGAPRCVDEEGVDDFDADKSVKDNDEGLEDACTAGYEAEGMKPGDGGQMVPNCVPKSAEINRIRVSEKSGVPDNRTPLKSDGGDWFYAAVGLPEETGREKADAEDVDVGLNWDSSVEVTEVDGDTVMMEESLTGSTWQEDRENVADYLEEIEERDHEYLYDMIAGQYSDLDAEDAEDILHGSSSVDDSE